MYKNFGRITEKYGAVINGDIIGSSQMTLSEKDLFLKQVDNLMQDYLPNVEGRQINFYRGDSFQIITSQTFKSLRFCFLLKSYFISQKQDLRISLSISEIDRWPTEKLQANGDALVLSGRGLDRLTYSKDKFIIQFGNKDFQKEFEIYSKVLDDIMNHWTTNQAYTTFGMIKGDKQEYIAGELSTSQQSVSRFKKGAKWDIVQTIIDRFHHIIDYYYNELKKKVR